MLITISVAIVVALLSFSIGVIYTNWRNKKYKTKLTNKVASVVRSITDAIGDSELTKEEALEIKKKAYSLILDDDFDANLITPDTHDDDKSNDDDKGRGTQRPYF